MLTSLLVYQEIFLLQYHIFLAVGNNIICFHSIILNIYNRLISIILLSYIAFTLFIFINACLYDLISFDQYFAQKLICINHKEKLRNVCSIATKNDILSICRF